MTDLIVKQTNIASWGTNIVPGNWNFAYPVFFFAYMVASMWIIFKKYKQSEGIQKSQLKSVLFGILISLVIAYMTNSLSFYIIGDYRFAAYGPYTTLIMIGFIAYAIIKDKLFDLKLIATEALVLLMLLGLLIDAILSSTFVEILLKALLLAIVAVVGYLLIKSVQHEIDQRQKIQKLVKNLEEANEHLKELDKVKDDFLSMASHELNTPIAAIEGYLSMILVEKMAGVLPPKAKQYLDSVFQSSQRLAHLVKDLLNVSRIESGRIHLIYEQKPMEDIIDQAVLEIGSKVKERQHTLIWQRPKKNLPLTWFDVTRITEVLINMLGNSCKYTDEGGRIEIKTYTDGDKIVVAIADNGKGIPKDKVDAVFQKFSQVDVLKDEVKGTGLGMWISQKIMELHKGKIWFHSDGENKGTTFYFSLPILAKKPHDPHEGEGSVLH
jgi:signal transduction histidine kinase